MESFIVTGWYGYTFSIRRFRIVVVFLFELGHEGMEKRTCVGVATWSKSVSVETIRIEVTMIVTTAG